ncbi:hypothetical protein ACFWM7_23570 [Streptomyces sp. NPDC058375]|uniref:hypothetical protein n=1 Tax=Streptomyces sp. NPDC058375 TaxID=3346467 RepID=UPI00364819C4
MAVRMTWRSYSVGADDLVTVYWFRLEQDWRVGYVAKALGVSGLSREYVDVTGTSKEIAAWAAAATAYVDEVAAAAAELSHVQWRTWRWRRRPVVCRWAEAKYDAAKAPYLDRVRAAASAYQPVRDVIEERIAEREAVRLQSVERRARRQRAAEARFQAWERRQAVADEPLPSGLTPRQMAARGDTPRNWPPQVEETVGDVARWWAGVCESVRNEQARAEAVQAVTEVITATAVALRKAGRPGLVPANLQRPSQVRYGWWVEFQWSRPGVELLRTPPSVPMDHLPTGGHWDYDLYLPQRMFFTERHLATVVKERIGSSGSTRPAWWLREFDEFAESLFPVRITYGPGLGWIGSDEICTRITDHADPDVFVPYVRAVAHSAMTTFRALMPSPR